MTAINQIAPQRGAGRPYQEIRRKNALVGDVVTVAVAWPLQILTQSKQRFGFQRAFLEQLNKPEQMVHPFVARWRLSSAVIDLLPIFGIQSGIREKCMRADYSGEKLIHDEGAFRILRGFKIFMGSLLLVTLVACGGGGGSGVDGSSSPQITPGPVPLVAVNPTLDFSLKTVELSWPAVAGAEFYEVSETVPGNAPIVVQATGLKASFPFAVFKKNDSQYSVRACRGAAPDNVECGFDSVLLSIDGTSDALNLRGIGYFKASNASEESNFGGSVAVSADGLTVAVGAPLESKAPANGQGGVGANVFLNSGAVYVFAKSAQGWVQTKIIKASDAEDGDQFGQVVALSADGNTLAVSSPLEKSVARIPNGDKNNNGFDQPIGAVYVYTKQGNDWINETYIKGNAPRSTTTVGMLFGTSISLSSTGDTLAVGAVNESSIISGPFVNIVSNPSAFLSGAAFVFTRAGGTWSQQSIIKAPNPGNGDNFGAAVVLSADGNTLAVGAPNEDGGSQVIGGAFDEVMPDAGAVYVYKRDALTWQNSAAYLKASKSHPNYLFGSALAMSADGSALVVGAPADANNVTEGELTPAGPAIPESGAAYVFSLTNNGWELKSYIKSPNPAAREKFGGSASMTTDGTLIAIGASGEDGSSRGINGSQSNKTITDAGAVHIYGQSNGTWNSISYVKASIPAEFADFGSSTALSGDGATLVVGSPGEAGCATGVVPDQSNIACTGRLLKSGAIYLY